MDECKTLLTEIRDLMKRTADSLDILRITIAGEDE